MSDPSSERNFKQGLTSTEVAERRKQFGPNKLPEKEGRGPVTIFFAQFKNPLIYIIGAAAIISLILQEWTDAIIIIIVILLDSIVGFLQEYRAQKTVAALRRLLKEKAKVIRDGKLVELETTEIVPDDLVAVNPGDKISADGKLVESINVSINEAILTGESEPIQKLAGDKAFMGTIALTGRGLMKVTATGIMTELGKIAGSLAEIKEEETPLQKRLGKFGTSLTYMVIAISILIFTVGILVHNVDPLLMLELAVVLAIAAIPEGLPIAVTMILVIGMRAILRRKGLVKKLLAVETLGSVTTICTDKTGTLTEGIMRVARTDFPSEQIALQIMALCNNLEDSLEMALWNHTKTKGMDPQATIDKNKRVYEVPFSSETKYMLTSNMVSGNEITHLKGAPDIVLEFCDMTSQDKQKWSAELEEWASLGLKMLGLAHKSDGNPRELKGFTWAGLVGIEDPVRPTVKDAIALCKKAGIETKMITGDYKKTAEKVAATLGLDVSPDQILEGKQIETMSDADLAKVVKNTVIFCRVQPQHKLRIVTALQSWREITSMIGDGVNDAPALKKANIGVSVGGATDVAQETASIILLDSNFKTLVDAVEEGRIIFDNIKKVVAYVLSNSFAEILTIFIAFLLNWEAPLIVAQILWIHLICDGPSDIALGFERGEEGVMAEPPTRMEESILAGSSKILIVAISASSAALCLLLFWQFGIVSGDLAMGRSIVFSVLAVQELIYIFSYRSLRTPLFKSKNFFANKPLIYSVALGLGLVLVALYIPGLNDALGVKPLDFIGWAMVLGVSFAMMGIVEFVKHITRTHAKSPIERLVLAVPGVRSVEYQSKRGYAKEILADLKVGVDPNMGPEEAQVIAQDVQQRVRDFDPKLHDVTVHVETAGYVATVEPEISQERITSALRRISEELGASVHDIWAYELDGKYFVESHLEADGSLSLFQAHDLSSKIEEKARIEFPRLQGYTTHIEPLGILTEPKPTVSGKETLAQTITQIATEVEPSADCHNIQIREIGGMRMVSLHIRLRGEISLAEAHRVSATLENRLRDKIPRLDRVIIHTEPQKQP